MRLSPLRLVSYVLAGIYLMLWGITWFAGLPRVDRDFDEEIAMGSIGRRVVTPMPVKRIPFFDSRDTDHYPETTRHGPWRCRTGGFAIAPFVIIDEVAWQDHVLSGYGGLRLVTWFFGKSHWHELKRYWAS